jgi:peptidoglycan/xylan/chitin deacetylase (PgdA/CDA1 family)
LTYSATNIPWGRLLKCGISLGVYFFLGLGNALVRLSGRKPAGSCVILNYHSIPADQRKNFARQMDILKSCATPLRIEPDITVIPGHHFAAITFDDGFENFIEEALPELRSRNIPVTIFIIVQALGKEFGSKGHFEKVMSVDQMRELPQDLVTIGSHTLTHPFLPGATHQDAHREIAESRVELERLLGRTVSMFSFPFGGFKEEHVEMCRAAGYQRIFTTLPYPAFTSRREFAVGRVRADTFDWPLETRLKVAGAYRWLPLAFTLKKKISNAYEKVPDGHIGRAASNSPT